MGLFALPFPDGTWQENVEAAAANINALVDDNLDQRSSYLISFAISCLETAKRKLDAEQARDRGSPPE